jgi:hypothetical protein
MFHVPRSGRVTDHPMPTLRSTDADGNNGAWILDGPEPGWKLILICSDGGGWEHVSVHAFRASTGVSRIPTWKEMCFVKDLCWDAEDVAMQLHPRRSAYVNQHPHTLHLWRPLAAAIPEPPTDFVGAL